MKVLLVHNFYAGHAPSGENVAVERDVIELAKRGIQISLYGVSNDELAASSPAQLLQTAIHAIWNGPAAAALKDHLAKIKPDVVHFHNSFPLLSPACLHASTDMGFPTVVTFHNYRFFCPAGIPLRASKTCTSCLGKTIAYPAVQYGCYRSSRLASIAAAGYVSMNNLLQIFTSRIDAAISLSPFQAQMLRDYGVPEEMLFVRANFVASELVPRPPSERTDAAIFIGRLSEEKGVDTLIEACKTLGERSPRIDIIGDGPLRRSLEATVNTLGLPPKITFHGNLDHSTTLDRLSRASFVIAPFRSFEGLPTVLVEAAALGIPVVSTSSSSASTVIRDNVTGLLVVKDDSNALAAAMERLASSSTLRSQMGQQFRADYEKTFSPDASFHSLMKCYDYAIQHRARRSKVRKK